MEVIRYVAADDHILFLKGFKLLLDQVQCRFPLVCHGEASNMQELQKIIASELPDLLFLDLNLADTDASQSIPKLKELHNAMRIICVSMYTDEKLVRDALKKGADGYLSKNTDLLDLTRVIDAVLEGEVAISSKVRISDAIKKELTGSANLNRFNAKLLLTKREKEILELIVKGKSNKDIAALLFISKDTVSVHRKNLMRKLHVQNASALLKVAYEYNLI